MKDPGQKRKQLWNVIIPQVCTEVINEMIILAILSKKSLLIKSDLQILICPYRFKKSHRQHNVRFSKYTFENRLPSNIGEINQYTICLVLILPRFHAQGRKYTENLACPMYLGFITITIPLIN